MLAVLFLIVSFINGYFTQRFFLQNKCQNLWLVSSFVSGSLSGMLIMLLSIYITASFWIGMIVMVIAAAVLLVTYRQDIFSLHIFKKETVIYFAILVLSFVLFEKSFTYDSSSHSFLIQTNLYQDFGAHIPFARYFSQKNIIEVPFYASSGLKYHFLFDFYAGVLERLGLRLDLAFNILSAFALTSLLIVIYELSFLLFKKKIVGVLASIFFIFNSDLSFITTFKSAHYSLSYIYHNNLYSTENFFNIPKLLNFLTINTLLNQRHLIFALLILFYVLLLLLQISGKFMKKTALYIGILFGFLPFINSLLWFALFVFLISFLFLYKKIRISVATILVVGLIISLPQLFIIKLGSTFSPSINPGFLVSGNISLFSFVSMWVWYMGVGIIFMTLGFMYANNKARKIFVASLLIFTLGNLIQFTPEMFDNHKLFNVSIIIFNMFSSWGLYVLYTKNKLFKVLAVIFFTLMVVSGICNLLVVKNDIYAKVYDPKNDGMILWIDKNTSPSEVFLTTGDIYDPVSIAGFRTFLGRPHYIYLYGGNPTKRIIQRDGVFKKDIVPLSLYTFLKSSNIHYIIIYNNSRVTNSYKNYNNFIKKNFKKVYENDLGIIYKT